MIPRLKLCFAATVVALSILGGNLCLAQIRHVLIGVDGLTCSQCTRSVEMQLRRLKFIDRVSMDLDSTQGTITLRESGPVSPELMATAVSDAGFTLRFLHIILDSPANYVVTDSCIVVADLVFRALERFPDISTDSWKLILPVSQFGRKRKERATECGIRGYDVIAKQLLD